MFFFSGNFSRWDLYWFMYLIWNRVGNNAWRFIYLFIFYHVWVDKKDFRWEKKKYVEYFFWRISGEQEKNFHMWNRVNLRESSYTEWISFSVKPNKKIIIIFSFFSILNLKINRYEMLETPKTTCRLILFCLAV